MQFTVRLPDDYKGKVTTAAKRMGLKKSDIARLALKQFLDIISQKTAERLLRRSSTFWEHGSRIKDLEQEHRRYLIAKLRKGLLMQVIMDTGPWVALIDRSESRHDECVTWLKSYQGEM